MHSVAGKDVAYNMYSNVLNNPISSPGVLAMAHAHDSYLRTVLLYH